MDATAEFRHSSSSSEDELDKLTRTFEEQATKDLHRVANRPKPKVKTQKSMKEIREEGLQAPVSEQSKGYKMLALMGYEKGRGLGKTSEGRSEPIEILLRGQRAGIGVDEERKRKREESSKNQAVRELKRQQLGQAMQKSFADQQATKLADRRYEGQLRSARQVIETLDVRKGLAPSFLWPPPEPVEEGEPESELGSGAVDQGAVEPKEPSWEDQPVKDKLLTALKYLRNTHNYCIHCGCQYDDPGDLDSNCPGMMDDAH